MNYIVTNIAKLTNIFTEIKQELENNPDKPINLSWEVTHRAKTKAQLGFIWGGLIKSIQKHFKDLYGKEYEPEIIKEMLYAECGTVEEFICPNGKRLFQAVRLSRMTVNEASEFIEKIINFCDDYGIILQPELKYLWINNLDTKTIKEIEQAKLPDKDKEFLHYVSKETCLICGKSNVEVHHTKLSELAGLGEKTPDWTGIPLCPRCHRYIAGGHINTERLIKLCPFIFDKLTVKQFLKLRYYRWRKHN